MSQSKNSFRHQSLQDAESIGGILDSLSAGMKRGKIVFSDEEGQIQMQPEGLLHLKVRARQEDDMNGISIKISWQSKDRKARDNRSLRVTVE